MLPTEYRVIAADLIDDWNGLAATDSLWDLDCGDVFDEIVRDARSRYDAAGLPVNDDVLLNTFQVVVATHALCARFEES